MFTCKGSYVLYGFHDILNLNDIKGNIKRKKKNDGKCAHKLDRLISSD